jgi:hypothetical protein
MKVALRHKKTGKVHEYESVDAREILEGDEYEKVEGGSSDEVDEESQETETKVADAPKRKRR